MVLRVNMQRTGFGTHQIGRSESAQLKDCDVAEIIAYTNLLSAADEAKVGGYLAG